MAKIVGPGSLIVDITGFAPHLPVAGETVKGTTIRLGPGGKGNNQMTAAHRAGSDVKVIGRCGNDFLGRVMQEHFATEGMSVEHIRVDEKDETGGAFIEIDERDAQNRIIVIFAANGKLTREDIYAAEKDFADCDLALTQFETTLEAVTATKELAHKYNKPFVLNPAPYLSVSNDFFAGVDFITPNETEAEQFTGIKVDTLEDCKRAAEKFLEMGVKNVIITLGVRGSFFTDGKQEIFVPALKVKAVETTGAGDAFNGGFATAIAEGLSIENALKFATCTAAISVTRYGSAPSMPKREEIIELLKKEFNVTI